MTLCEHDCGVQLQAEVERWRGLATRTRRLLVRLYTVGLPSSKLASDTEDAILLHDAALAREGGGELEAEVAQLREALDGVCGLTGTWAQCVGERDWRVRFSFEGETHFETQDEAREAGKAYERIIAEVHGEAIARLTAEVERLRSDLADAELRASMACEQQPCGDCPGCAIAAEHYADAPVREEAGHR